MKFLPHYQLEHFLILNYHFAEFLFHFPFFVCIDVCFQALYLYYFCSIFVYVLGSFLYFSHNKPYHIC
ncbi:unnamed protein product [Meloidogyne enterolobii]|uniref:Uncharacterized protein n=1 Tax=Meloidogyne enterolobii TaxID=390850 RepID=A0ACB0Y613_MELEN